MRYALGRDERGRPIEISDPLAAKFAAIAAEKLENPAEIADRFLAIREVFGSDLPAQGRFRSTVTESLRQLLENGAADTVRRFVRLDGKA
jgi:fructuronate reductase